MQGAWRQMKKIPIIAGAATGTVVPAIMPALGVSRWPAPDPIGSPSECYFQASDGLMEPCSIETGPTSWPSLAPFDQDCEESCDVPMQAQSALAGGAWACR